MLDVNNVKVNLYVPVVESNISDGENPVYSGFVSCPEIPENDLEQYIGNISITNDNLREAIANSEIREGSVPLNDRMKFYQQVYDNFKIFRSHIKAYLALESFFRPINNAHKQLAEDLLAEDQGEMRLENVFTMVNNAVDDNIFKDPQNNRSMLRALCVDFKNMVNNATQIENDFKSNKLIVESMLEKIRLDIKLTKSKYTISNKETENNKITNEYEKTLIDLTNEKAQVTSLTDENKDLNTQVTSLTDENKDLNTQVTSLTDENKDLNTQVTSLTDEKDDLNTQVELLGLELSELKEQKKDIVELNDNIKSLELELVDLTRKKQEITVERNALKKQIAKQKQVDDNSSNDESKQSIKKKSKPMVIENELEVEFRKLKKEIVVKDQLIEEYELNISDLESNSAELALSNDALLEVNAQLTIKVVEKDETINGFQEALQNKCEIIAEQTEVIDEQLQVIEEQKNLLEVLIAAIERLISFITGNENLFSKDGVSSHVETSKVPLELANNLNKRTNEVIAKSEAIVAELDYEMQDKEINNTTVSDKQDGFFGRFTNVVINVADDMRNNPNLFSPKQ